MVCLFSGHKSVDHHVGDAEILVLLRRAIIDFDLDLRIVLWSVRIVDEAIGERVIHDDCERSLAFFQHSNTL